MIYQKFSKRAQKQQKEKMIIVVVMMMAIPLHPITMNMKVMGLEKKQPATGLLLWTTFQGLADKSKKIASFVTVAHKSNYTCVYIFHTIYREKAIWRTILSQTNILKIFPASFSLIYMRRILESVYIRKRLENIFCCPHFGLAGSLLNQPIGKIGSV